MRFIIGSQKSRRLELPPIGSPKQTKETFPTLHRKTDTASRSQELGILTPTNMFLLNLTFKPDIISNNTGNILRDVNNILYKYYYKFMILANDVTQYN
jgi:hypothetical protein